MSDAKEVELTPANRIAQASMVVAEQVGMSFLSDVYRFPASSQGHVQIARNDGLLKFDGPVDEYVKTSMMYKQDETTKEIGTWNHTETLDGNLRTQETIDQVNRGFLLDVLLTGKLGSHTDFKAPDGSLQLKMDGFTVLTPSDKPGTVPPGGKWPLPVTGDVYVSDWTNTLKAPDNTYLGEVHLTAKPVPGQGNSLDIIAIYTRTAAPIGTNPPVITPLGSVEMVVTVDPNTQQSADYQLFVKNPPPPQADAVNATDN